MPEGKKMIPNPRPAAEFIKWVEATTRYVVPLGFSLRLDALLDAYARQQVEAALERVLSRVGMEANRHAHLENQGCTCCAKWYAAILERTEGRG